jgi:phosphomannomutase / phosphoglucomutase
VLGHIFRTYDIRGIVDSELIINQSYRLGRAIAAYFIQRCPSMKTVVVGMDGRCHSESIKNEIIRALCDSGLTVLFAGMCPTPVVYFALHTLSADAGLIITASHNGPSYNGIKICLGIESVWGSQIALLRTMYEERAEAVTGLPGSVHALDIINDYITWLVNHFQHLKNKQLPLVIDCANGVTGVIMPELVKRFGWQQITLLYEQVDGMFPHHEADPTVDDNMQSVRSMMKIKGAVLGIGFDGDGDRMAPMTRSGELVAGDKLLLFFSKYMLDQHPGSTIIFDIKCSSIVPSLITTWGGISSVTPSGHSIIKHAMRSKNALFGGELSCHFFFGDRYFGYDDGIYAALRLIELMIPDSTCLENFLSSLPVVYVTPELRVTCSEKDKEIIVAHARRMFEQRDEALLITIDGVRATLPYGWGLVRASNTQAHISIRCESSSKDGLVRIKNDFIHILRPYIDEMVLHSVLGDCDYDQDCS